MQLETKNLTLSNDTPFHPDLHVRWLNDKELMKYSEQRHREHTHRSQIRYLGSFDDVTSFFWEIYPKGLSLPVGTITAYIDPYNEVADVGILIGAFHSRGYGSEAWRAVCDWLLTERPMRKITAGCMASNQAMVKVFGKTGMVIEGRRRGQFLLNGKPEDMILAARFK